MNEPASIFVSYRNLDRGIARLVRDLIKSAGSVAFFDEEQSRDDSFRQHNQATDGAIQRHLIASIARADALVAIITKRTRGGWWVPFEIGLALASNKPVFLLCAPAVRPPDFGGGELISDAHALAEWARKVLPRHDPKVLLGINRLLYEVASADLPSLSRNAITALDSLFHEGAERRFVLEDNDYAEKRRWLGSRSLALADVLYDFTAPIYSIEREGALLDGSELEREIGGLLFRSWIDDQSLANWTPSLPYRARRGDNWREQRKADPAVHWLQGMRTDEVASYFRMLGDENGSLLTREAFRERFVALYDAPAAEQKAVGLACNPLQAFSLAARPVFARLAAVQILLHSALLKLAETGGVLNAPLPLLFDCSLGLRLSHCPELDVARAFINAEYSFRASTFDATRPQT